MKKIIALTILLIIGCKGKDISIGDEEIITKQISGKVILPTGSGIDVQSLFVQSYFASNDVESEAYTLEVAENSDNFLFVADRNNKVILMGYNYPGQTQFDLNAESTVIALAMSLPITDMLSEQAKIRFVNEMKQSVEYSGVVNIMQDMIKNKISPLDENQELFRMKLLKMIESSVSNNKDFKARKGRFDYDEKPVNIIVSGNTILFQNSGKLYNTVIGIYKDGKKIEDIELGKINIFAESASEVFRISNNIITQQLKGLEVIHKPYEFKENGEYEIKISTGLGTDFSSEQSVAFRKNITGLIINSFVKIIPLKADKKKLKCIQEAIDKYLGLSSAFESLGAKKNKSLADVLSASYDLSSGVLGTVKTTLGCFANDSASKLFVGFMEKLFKYDAWVTRIGAIGNTSAGVVQWLYDDSSMQLCYSKLGTEVYKCGFKDLSEDIQNVVPAAVLDSLIAKGVVINRGDNPPMLDFSIVISPYELKTPYGPGDNSKPGRVISDYYYKFYDQNSNGGIKYDFYNDGSHSGNGLGSFISGENGNFTIFSESTSTSGSESSKSLRVISGSISEKGIDNFQNAFILTYKSKPEGESNLIPVNTGRVWIDGDFLSEKYFDFKKNKARTPALKMNSLNEFSK